MDPHRYREPRQRGWRDRLRALENIPPLLKMVWETSRVLTVAMVAVALLRGAMPVGILYIGKLIIDTVARSIRTGQIDSPRLWGLVAIEFSLAILADLLSRAGNLTYLLGDMFTNRVSVRMIHHAAALDLADLEDPQFYDKLERARLQTAARQELIKNLVLYGRDAVSLISLTTSLAVYSPWLLVLLVCAVIPSFISEMHFSSLNYALLYRGAPQRRELDYFRWLGATQESSKEVKMFGLGGFFAERYRRLADKLFSEIRALRIRRAVIGFFLTMLGTAGYYGAYVVILYRTVHGALTLGDLTFLAGAFSRSRTLIDDLLNDFSSITEQALYLDDLFSFLNMEPGIRTRPGARPMPRPIRRGLEFRNVTFRYPGADHDAVTNLSFALGPDQRIALIGENGAGKTTVTKLIARLYDPTEGVILLDGVDLREYDLEDLRREIGVIFQDFMRYHMLLRENIGVGRVERIDDRPHIERAAQLSLASDVAARLERGLDQMVGRRFAEGVDLSGGEWQKVALGRAYMRDAQVLILDEPTAALDARAEHAVFERFADLTRGKIAVLISHRFSTVRMADHILVLHQGRILEEGTHEELVRLGGQYAELFELQAAGYR